MRERERKKLKNILSIDKSKQIGFHAFSPNPNLTLSNPRIINWFFATLFEKKISFSHLLRICSVSIKWFAIFAFLTSLLPFLCHSFFFFLCVLFWSARDNNTTNSSMCCALLCGNESACVSYTVYVCVCYGIFVQYLHFNGLTPALLQFERALN